MQDYLEVYQDALVRPCLAICRLSIEIYRNKLENREFGKEAPLIFCPAPETVFIDTTRARDEKYGGKLTLLKTDFLGCLCISAFIPNMIQKLDII